MKEDEAEKEAYALSDNSAIVDIVVHGEGGRRVLLRSTQLLRRKRGTCLNRGLDGLEETILPGEAKVAEDGRQFI